MKTFPMFLQMASRRVVIVGGGEQAAQKARLIVKTEALIEVWAPKLDPELGELAAAGRVTHQTGPITSAAFQGTALVFIATGSPGIDMALHALAKEGGATVNVVDQPHLSDAITPSIVDRNPVVVAIETGEFGTTRGGSVSLVAAAKCGQRIVRLKCGDPGILGRSTEETDALKANRIPFEIVPGVTAACAAAASIGESLTDRGHIDTPVLTTGHRHDGYTVPDPIKDIRPGTCVALYMAVGAAPQIMAQLQADHPRVTFDVQIVSKAQRKGEVVLKCALRHLE